MHEMGIASSVLDAVRLEGAKYPGAKPSRVGLRIGEWAGVDVASLRFCLDVLIAGSELAGLDVEVDYRLRRNLCSHCGSEFPVRDYKFECPHCACEVTSPVSGTELDVAYIELEEPA
jgi:hydrogenase nickel incorporation protein HypA/HybF